MVPTKMSPASPQAAVDAKLRRVVDMLQSMIRYENAVADASPSAGPNECFTRIARRRWPSLPKPPKRLVPTSVGRWPSTVADSWTISAWIFPARLLSFAGCAKGLTLEVPPPSLDAARLPMASELATLPSTRSELIVKPLGEQGGRFLLIYGLASSTFSLFIVCVMLSASPGYSARAGVG